METPPASSPRKRAARPPGPSAARGGSPAQERELRAQGKKTMRKLLDAAMTVFERRGYHAPRAAGLALVAMVERLNYYIASRRMGVEPQDTLDTVASLVHVGFFGGTRRKRAPSRSA